MIGYVHSIESMGLADGPGIRSVVFMQGCLLRCKYCHNPDTWNNKSYAYALSPNELVEKIIRFKGYFDKDGGVTFSGGEPLLQIDFVIESFKMLKQKGIHTCLDTSGVFNEKEANCIKKIRELFKYTDLVLLDIKHYDKVKYKEITNRDISTFNLFLEEIQKTDIPIWIRHVVVPNLTDGKEHIENLRQYVSKLKNIKKIELLPYHTMGIQKYKELNIPYSLLDTKKPTDSQMEYYQRIIDKEI